MASTLPVFDDTQGYTGTLSYVTSTEGGEATELIGWYHLDDIPALQAIATSADNELAMVDDIGGFGAGWYRWDGSSGLAADGLLVVAPDDGGAGRWLKF